MFLRFSDTFNCFLISFRSWAFSSSVRVVPCFSYASAIAFAISSGSLIFSTATTWDLSFMFFTFAFPSFAIIRIALPSIQSKVPSRPFPSKSDPSLTIENLGVFAVLPSFNVSSGLDISPVLIPSDTLSTLSTKILPSIWAVPPLVLVSSLP